MKLYSYASNVKTNLKIKEVMAFPDMGKPGIGLKKYILEYDSPYKTGIKENDSVYAELFLGKNDTLFILVHGFASNRKKIVNYNSFMYNLSLIHISEPTRRTPISYAVFCLKKKKK